MDKWQQDILVSGKMDWRKQNQNNMTDSCGDFTRPTVTIEPMICEGSAKALTWPDEWTATTVRKK